MFKRLITVWVKITTIMKLYNGQMKLSTNEKWNKNKNSPYKCVLNVNVNLLYLVMFLGIFKNIPEIVKFIHVIVIFDLGTHGN